MNVNRNEIIINDCRDMFESRISAGATKKFLGWRKPHVKTVARSYEKEGYVQKWSNCTKSQALAWMSINSSRKNSNLWKSCPKFALKSS